MKTRDEILWLVGQAHLSQLYAKQEATTDPEDRLELEGDAVHLRDLLDDLWEKGKGAKTHVRQQQNR